MTLDDKVPARAVSLSFSQDSSLLAVGYNSYPAENTGDNFLRVWEPFSGCLKYKLKNNRGINWALAMSPDNKIVASSFWRVPEIQLWDLSRTSIIKRIETISGFNRSFEFSPDGKMLLSGGNNFVELRSMPEGKLLNSFETDKNIRRTDFSPDGTLIAASTIIANDIFIWRVNDGTLLQRINQRDDPSVYDDRSVYVRFSRDENLLAASYKNEVNIWDLQGKKIIKTFNANSEYERFGEIVFSPDDRFLVALANLPGYWDRRQIYIWNVPENALIRIIKISGDPYDVTPTSLSMSPNGRFLAIGSFGGKIFIYGISENSTTSSCPPPVQIDGTSSSSPQIDVTPQSYPYVWEFESDGDTEGWSRQSQLTPLQVSQGYLITKSIGNDPFMVSPSLTADAEILKRIEIRMSVSAGDHAKLYFVTDSHRVYNESKIMRFPIISDGKFHTYTLYMTGAVYWKGVITQIRLDPVDDPVDREADIKIDYIRLTQF